MYLSWQRHECHTKHAWHIAREGSSVVGDLAVRTIVSFTHSGITGQGEAAPTSYYNESLDTVEATCEDVNPVLPRFAPAFDEWAATLRKQGTDLSSLDRDPAALNDLIDYLIKTYPEHRAAISAIDLALHDWWGKLAGAPLWRILGIDRDATPPTSMSIGIDDLALLPGKIDAAQDFGILKMKVGTDNDVATLTRFRELAPDKVLRVDANCGWSAENVIERVKQLEPFKLEFIEQPLPSGEFEAVKKLRSAIDLPIIADEDSVTPDDVARLAEVYDGINIKLSKCGGIREARRMIDRARQQKLKIMLGCMVETSLGIAGAAQLAPLVDYVDLDGHLLLADDPYEGLIVEKGRVLAGNSPGLGVRLRNEE
jgi:L-alanine-DL-glutamate epimerase-like enolase superfamily enzyme